MIVSQDNRPSMTTDDLLRGFADPETLPCLRINNISSNSKTVETGDLFIALAGLTRHAIDFVPDVVTAGAVAVVYDAQDPYCQQRIPLLKKQLDTHWIAVPNLQKVTGEIASRFYGHPSRHFELIGVTGTDGKTSVTHLLIQALTRLNVNAGSIGTLGYGPSNRLSMTRYTTPDAITLQSLLSELYQSGCECVVMEVSSHALEQYRVSGCVFDIAVLTNLGSDHLDYHGTLEQYALAKSSLFESADLTARVLNLNDEFGRQLSKRYKGGSVNSYSSSATSNEKVSVKLQRSRMTDQGLQIDVKTESGLMTIQTQLIGSFNIDNCLACISVLTVLGFDNHKIQSCMQQIKPIPGRMEYFPSLKSQPAVVIDFAHTEQALAACLEAVKDYTNGDLYCVFGCGGDRDQSKRPKMAAVAEKLAQHVFLTDDNPRAESAQQIMQNILAGFKHPQQVRVIHDRQTAIETAMSQAGEKDLVVIAGKGHEKIQIIGDHRLAFSDHQVVRQIREAA